MMSAMEVTCQLGCTNLVGWVIGGRECSTASFASKADIKCTRKPDWPSHHESIHLRTTDLHRAHDKRAIPKQDPLAALRL